MSTKRVGNYGGQRGIEFIRGSVDGDTLFWSELEGDWVTQAGELSTFFSEKTIQLIGDSNFVTANETDAGNVGGVQSTIYQHLRQSRDDFDFVGTVNLGPVAVQETGLSSLGAWYTQGIGGQTIPGAAASFAGWVAAMGRPSEIIIDMLGTNDIIGGRTAVQMLGDRATLDAAYRANAPDAKIVSVGIPPFVAGTTVAGNLAAWNAVRVAYNTAYRAQCAQNGRPYINPDALAPGDYQPSGVHLNQRGQGFLGRIISNLLGGLLGRPQGNPLPRRFRNRKPWGSVEITTNLDSLGAAAHAGFNPGAASFAIAFDYRPTVIAAGPVTICGYNAIAARPDFWALYQVGAGLEVEFGSGAVDIVNQPQELSLAVDTWYRVVLIAYANGADSAVGIYLNGALVGLATGLAAWNFGAGHAFAFGTTPGVVGTQAFIGRVSTYKGAIPKPGTMTALRAVEGDYFDGEDLFTGSGASSFPLNVALADEISGNPPLVGSGGALLRAAWPGATPQRPWEGIT